MIWINNKYSEENKARELIDIVELYDFKVSFSFWHL